MWLLHQLILNLLWTIPRPFWAPVSSSVKPPGQALRLWHPARFWCSVPSRVSEVTAGWGHGIRWEPQSGGISSGQDHLGAWVLCPLPLPRCLEKKQRCVINQRNRDKYSPCWINIPRITHVSFKVKQRSCATWQPPIWPEKSRHMDGSH